jgi:hypothetical protein
MMIYKQRESIIDYVTDIIDLAKYPINDLNSSQGREFLKRCRQALRETGLCQLSEFMLPRAVDNLVTEGKELVPLSFSTDSEHNVYFSSIDKTLPEADPRRLMQRSAKKAIAYDQIPSNSLIRHLYEWDDFIQFIAAALEKEVLYRSADPFDACEIVVFEPSDELGWHFDNSEFSVTLMLQPAESGGEFQYIPHLRSPEDNGYQAVKEVLDGKQHDVIAPRQSPGTFSLFCGRYAMHRVTPISGSRPRINAVLSYSEKPGMKLTELTQRLFYGRTG